MGFSKRNFLLLVGAIASINCLFQIRYIKFVLPKSGNKNIQDDVLSKPVYGNLGLDWDNEHHVYTRQGKPIIWTFWDNDPMPPHIAFGMTSVQCHNPEFHVQRVSLQDISKWIDNIHPAFNYLIPAHKADYFRARILDLYGGIYIDADSVGLDSYWTWYEKLVWYDAVNIDWAPDGDVISIGYIGPIRAHTKFTAMWVTQIHIKLSKILSQLEDKNKAYPIEWAAICRNIAIPTIERVLSESLFALFTLPGQKTFGQLNYATSPARDINKDNASFSWNRTQLLLFHNSGVGQSIHNLTAAGFLQGSTTLLAELFRYTMQQCYYKHNKPEMTNDNITLSVLGSKPSIGITDAQMHWIMDYIKHIKIL